MRIVGTETMYTRIGRPIWVGPPYHRFWGDYWGWGWRGAWAPAYVNVTPVVRVETMIYSLDRDELVWAGVTRTFDPGRIDRFIGELAIEVSKQLGREGLIRIDGQLHAAPDRAPHLRIGEMRNVAIVHAATVTFCGVRRSDRWASRAYARHSASRMDGFIDGPSGGAL